MIMNSYDLDKHEQLLNKIFSNTNRYRDNFPSNLPIIEVIKLIIEQSTSGYMLADTIVNKARLSNEEIDDIFMQEYLFHYFFIKEEIVFLEGFKELISGGEEID